MATPGPGNTVNERDSNDVLEDESNGFGGAQDPGLSDGSFKKERRKSHRRSSGDTDTAATELGSSSDEQPTSSDEEASVNSFQSAMEDDSIPHMQDDSESTTSSHRSMEGDSDLSTSSSRRTSYEETLPTRKRSTALNSSSSSPSRSNQNQTKANGKFLPSSSDHSGEAYKRDRPEPLKDDSEANENAAAPEQWQLSIVPYEGGGGGSPGRRPGEEGDDEDEEELIIMSNDPLKHPPTSRRRPSMGQSYRDSSASDSMPFPPHQPLDPKEEERRRNEVQTAMEILEHMRRANMVMEFGPGVDLEACVFCLREQHKPQDFQVGSGSNLMITNGQPPCKKKQSPSPLNPLNMLPKIRHERPCIICHSPVCKKHWDDGFFHQQNVILCQDCAPLFDLDNLCECLNLFSSAPSESQRDQQEQHMKRLLIVYDRALLALRHSSQSFDDNARSRLVQTKWHKEGMGVTSHVTNIASGVTGIAATAVFMTPMGPWLLLTSLALGGFATAVGSGSYFMERMCPTTQQAEQTIALASMVDSLLEATAILRQAQIAGALPPADSFDDDTSERDDYDDDSMDNSSNKTRSSITTGASETSPTDSGETGQILFLEEDKDQRLMVTILKAKKDREERPKNPVQFVTKRINKIGKERAEEKKRRQKRDKKWGVDAERQQAPKGPLKRAAFRMKREVNRVKDTTGNAVTVAKTATTLAAVGMQAGGGCLVRGISRTARGALGGKKNNNSSSRRRSSKRGNGGDLDISTNSGSTEASSSSRHQRKRSHPGLADRTSNAARHGLGMFARSFFNAAATETGQDKEEESSDDETKLESEEDHQRRKKQQGHSIPSPPEDSSPPPQRPNRIPRIHFPLDDVLLRIFRPQPTVPGDRNQGAIVAEIRRGDYHLKLRASGRAIKAFNRMQKAKRRLKQRRRKRLVAMNDSDDGDHPGGRRRPVANEADRVFVKNARFLVKASLTVLRETARYAGGAFSAAIVCVETMELKDKVERIRSKNGIDCSNVDKLDELKQHVWENSGGFPDSFSLEWELFANPHGDIAEVSHVKRSPMNPRSTINERTDVEGTSAAPHWSSCFEGQRPDGSQANLPEINDSISENSAYFASKANSTAYPAF